MSIFSRFPYTDFHRLNADWILDKVKEAVDAVAESLGLVRQSAADAAAAAAAAEQAVDGSVRYDRVQTISAAEQRQAQSNMNVADASVTATIQLSVSDLNSRTVQVDQPQTFTTQQQAQGRANIGAVSEAEYTDWSEGVEDILDLQGRHLDKCVRFDAQGLTTAEQAQARANIGAAAEGSGPAPVGAVLYDQAQSLTAAQKIQARANIGALPAENPSVLTLNISDPQTAQDILISSDSPASGPVLILEGSNQGGGGLDVVVSGVAAPLAANDAANKAYVDSIRGPHLSTIAGNDVIIQADAASARNNTLYNCTAAELNSLEIQAAASPAANRELTVRFTSGATATELDTPVTILGLDDLVPAANTIYEINIMGNLAVWHAWEVPA